MSNKYVIIVFSIIISTIIQVVAINVFAQKTDSIKTSLKIKDSRPNRPIFSSNISTDFEAFMIKVSAIKASTPLNKSVNSIKTISSLAHDSQKPLDNVKIFPNPVSNLINLSYTLNKEYVVTIKVLDVLGNEVLTLLSQKVSAGDQTNSFNLGSKINSGLYFVRVAAGSESVIKRISIL